MEKSSHTGQVRSPEKMALLVAGFVLVFGASAILLIYSFRKPIPNIVLLSPRLTRIPSRLAFAP
jgi:hypothetical protein